jgi:2'-5' RNA ligase
MRLFVALDVPEAVREQIRTLIRELEPLCPGARWVRTEGLHVTLKFIGEVSLEKAGRIRAALGTIQPVGPVEMTFRNTGFFPNAKHPRVFWVGMEASPNLAELAAAIEAGLEPLGIAREKRAFQPHLTLARFKSEAGLEKLREALGKLGPLEFGRATADSFDLYESKLRPSGAEYTKLASFSLTRAA